MSKQSRLKNILMAVSYWLNFEKICRKENLFNEKYLSYAIGQYLQSHFTSGLRTEYIHPLLYSKQVGSKPKIDFVVVEPSDGVENIKVAIETKWLSESQSLIKDCVKDVFRLSILADHYENIVCYFIVCGKYSDWLSKIENNKKFYFITSKGRRVNLFNLGVPGANNIHPAAKGGHFSPLYESALKELNLKDELPDRIRVTFYGRFPDTKKRNDYVAIGWKIKTYKHFTNQCIK